MPKVLCGDVELFYIDVGAGDPLVLIMGFGGDHLAWGFQVPAFAQHHRVIAFDNRGAGQSDAPDAPYTTRMMADDTARLMDAAGIERAHVLGVSMGGMIAQELALNHPDRVRSLQLHCTYARPDNYLKGLSAAWRRVRTTLDREQSFLTIFPWLFSPRTYNERPEFVDVFLQNALANPHPQSVTGFIRQSEAIANHDALERLDTIRCPTLVSVAEDDMLVPPRFARELAAAIPGATFRMISGAAHVYFWEKADEFNAMCLEFSSAHAAR